MKTLLPENLVELKDAMSRINRWRSGPGADNLTKAFYISRTDIEALYNELNLLGHDYIGVRAYLGTRQDMVEAGNATVDVDELLLVAVVKDHKHLDNPNGLDLYEVGADKEPRIYDLTSPCPRMCDKYSPLFTLIPPNEKPQLNLTDLPKE